MNEAGKYSILIVDDDDSNIIVLGMILEGPYIVHSAKSGKEALEMAQRIRPDLILLDIVMPDMSGFEVLTRLKGMDDINNIPVIFVTGLAGVEDEAKGFMLGASDYITKPFHSAIVEARVSNQVKSLKQMRLIEQSAMLDALTGIPNRRSYDKRLAAEWSIALRENRPIGHISLDVDMFKAYNDRFGHPKGDAVLQAVAGAIVASLKRPTDFAARVGGEEFSVILPGTPLDGTCHIADLIRTNVEELGIPHHEEVGAFCVTVSLGAHSIIPAKGDRPDAFVDCCDKALYSAKANGRNRVCQYINLV